MRKFEKLGSSYGFFFVFFAKVFFLPDRVLFFPQHLLFSFPSASVLRGNRGATHDHAHALGNGGRAEGKESANGAG